MANQTDIAAGIISTNQAKGNGSTFAFQRRSVANADADLTLSSSQYDGSIIEITGALTGDKNIILPLTDGTQLTVFNNTTGAHNLTFKGASGTGIAIAATKRAIIYCDGTNWVRVTADT